MQLILDHAAVIEQFVDLLALAGDPFFAAERCRCALIGIGVKAVADRVFKAA